MEISLEKIELVKDRTGVSYKEAKEALEKTEGNVVDAIIMIEDSIDEKSRGKFNSEKNEIIEKLKEVLKKGNVSKVIVKRDGEVILNIPVTAGVLGTIIFPWPVVVATITALAIKCSLEIIKDNGEVINISEFTNEKIGDMKDKASDAFVDMKDKASDAFVDMKDKMNERKEKRAKEADDEHGCGCGCGCSEEDCDDEDCCNGEANTDCECGCSEEGIKEEVARELEKEEK